MTSTQNEKLQGLLLGITICGVCALFILAMTDPVFEQKVDYVWQQVQVWGME